MTDPKAIPTEEQLHSTDDAWEKPISLRFCLTSSIARMYASLELATAAKLLASEVACKWRRGKVKNRRIPK